MPFPGNLRRQSSDTSGQRNFWERAATQNAAWYTATEHNELDEAFYAEGDRETSAFFDQLDLPTSGAKALEIGCGPGRMTGRLRDMYDDVTAVDISEGMLDQARRRHDGRAGMTFRRVDGDGTLPFDDESFDLVFSYIALQHIPSVQHQLTYLAEAIRVLRPGGTVAIQIRADSIKTKAHELAGYVAHAVRGKPTWSRSWRGGRLKRGEIAALCLGAGVELDVRRTSVRHDWLIIRKPAR